MPSLNHFVSPVKYILLCIVTHICCRCGIALALNKLSQYLNESQVTPLFLFFVPDALNDRHAEVRRCMLDAALSALNTHGKVQFNAHFLFAQYLFI